MKRAGTMLVAGAAASAAIAAMCGLFWPAGAGDRPAFVSVNGEPVVLLGTGLYRHDSLMLGAGFLGQDLVTLALAVPALLVIAWQLSRQPSPRWLALAAALLSFILYVYATMALGAFYNPLFLVYVATFSLSLFALSMTLRALYRVASSAWSRSSPAIPRRTTAIVLALCGVFTGLVWLQPLIGALLAGTPPPLLDHSTTKVTEALDLAIIVPGSLCAAALVWQGRIGGLLLAIPLLGLLVMLLPTIVASTASQLVAGISFTMPEIVGPIGGFLVFGVLAAASLWRLVAALDAPPHPGALPEFNSGGQLMSTLIVYDSGYGNTAKVAHAIAAALPGGAAVHRITDIAPSSLPRHSLLIVGSPTHGGRPSQAMQDWLAGIPRGNLAGVEVAAFDTRLATGQQGFALRLLMGVIGFAAPRILKVLETKGGTAVASAEGFIVQGKEGPVAPGELDRAALWGRALGVQERAAA